MPKRKHISCLLTNDSLHAWKETCHLIELIHDSENDGKTLGRWYIYTKIRRDWFPWIPIPSRHPSIYILYILLKHLHTYVVAQQIPPLQSTPMPALSHGNLRCNGDDHHTLRLTWNIGDHKCLWSTSWPTPHATQFGPRDKTNSWSRP